MDSSPHLDRPRIGVSGCLLGQAVRFNGGHAKSAFIVGKVADLAELVPVCPEVEVGMGTPRETVRLIRAADDAVRMIAPKSGQDWTDRMRKLARSRAEALSGENLSGFILKKDSPSCGMERVKVYDANSVPSKSGVGLFAEELRKAMPLLPMEEEGRLNDPRLRECFFVRVFAYQRLERLFAGEWKVRELVEFHASEKILLMAHAPEGCRRLGRLVAGARGGDRASVESQYRRGFMEALAKPAPVRRHVNALEHIVGFFKRGLDAADKQELLGLINDFRRGLAPLETPLALVRHYVRTLDADYIGRQSYLQPHPRELALRSAL